MRIGKSSSKSRCRQTNLVCSKYSWGILEDVTTPGKSCNFYSHLSLQTELHFPAVKLTQNCYININIFFSWYKLAISWYKLTINWVPSFSPSNMRRLKDYSHNLTKYEIKETLKISIIQPRLIFKRISFPFASLIRKKWKSSESNIQKS